MWCRMRSSLSLMTGELWSVPCSGICPHLEARKLGFCTLIPVSYGMSQDEGKAPPAGVAPVTQGKPCKKLEGLNHV